MKVWITKYALTQGIYSVEASPSHTAKMVSTKQTSYSECFHKPYWHETEEAAKLHAAILRSKKLVSLERQIERIKALKF